MNRANHSSRHVEYVLLIIFAAVSVWLLVHHEPGTDEAHSWLIDRDSPDLPSLFRMMPWENTPALWHLLVFPLAKAGMPYVGERVLHLLIIVGAAAVFLLAAPLPRLEKGLAVFGYFPLYEYNAITRSYTLAVLLLFGIAACWPRRLERPGRVCLMIALLAQTSMQTWLLAVALAVLLTYELAVARSGASRRAYVAGALLMVVSFGAALYEARPPAGLDAAQMLHLDPAMVARSCWNSLMGAFLPVPSLQLHFWGTRLITTHLIAPLLLLPIILLWKRPRTLWLFLLCSVPLLGLIAAKGVALPRYYGMIYLVFLTCLWLAHYYPGSGPVIHPRLRPVLIGLLGIQVLAAVPAVYYDTHYEFSAGESVARYLQEEGLLRGHPLVATFQSCMGEAVLASLDRPDLRFFSLETEDYRTFGVWTQNNRNQINMLCATPALQVTRLEKEVDRTKPTTALLISAPTSGRPEPVLLQRYQLLARFGPAIDAGNTYDLYRVR